MTDLISKYKNIIVSEDKILWQEYAYVLDKCIEHLKPMSDLSINIKIGATYVIKELYLNCNNFNVADIMQTIDDFLEYYKKEYEPYMKGFALISDQFYADLCFYDSFIKEKINSLQLQP